MKFQTTDKGCHMLSDHFQYLVQRSPRVLLLEILCQSLKVDGAISSPSMCPELNNQKKEHLLYDNTNDL